jgi:hypothetical protein
MISCSMFVRSFSIRFFTSLFPFEDVNLSSHGTKLKNLSGKDSRFILAGRAKLNLRNITD